MFFKQVKECCLYVENLEATENFYHGTLELPLISKAPGRHVFFRAGTTVLLCFNPRVTETEESLPPHFAYGKQHIAFEVSAAEYDKIKEKIILKGINITHTQKWGNKGESFYFEDPNGHVLEIVPEGLWD